MFKFIKLNHKKIATPARIRDAESSLQALCYGLGEEQIGNQKCEIGKTRTTCAYFIFTPSIMNAYSIWVCVMKV